MVVPYLCVLILFFAAAAPQRVTPAAAVRPLANAFQSSTVIFLAPLSFSLLKACIAGANDVDALQIVINLGVTFNRFFTILLPLPAAPKPGIRPTRSIPNPAPAFKNAEPTPTLSSAKSAVKFPIVLPTPSAADAAVPYPGTKEAIIELTSAPADTSLA